MAFLIGAIGALLFIAVLFGGIVLGWKAKEKDLQRATAKVEPASDRELRELKAQQEAFRQLQHYSAETAYGIGQNEMKEADG